MLLLLVVSTPAESGLSVMAVILVPASGDDLTINWWNWRPTVALLVRAGVLPPGERADRCESNGCGGYLSATEAIQAADHIESLVARMATNERLLSRGEIVAVPESDKPVSEWTEEEAYQRYAARRELLVPFADFCRRSGGFQVV
ncbi:MAG TPA: hypothetical protein VFB80_05000 [Pirellulaceae bacterium]|nr:hypothetical protein [Pirellulaceae bacterium]